MENSFNALLNVTNAFVTYYKIMILTGKRKRGVYKKIKRRYEFLEAFDMSELP